MITRHDERWDDAVGAYLLQAMPPDEAADFEAHLETCERCRAEVDHLRVAADALPSSPPQFEPPPELKARIMAVVNAEAELLRAAGARADEPAGEPPPRRRRFAVLRRGWWSVRPGLALAGAMGVLMLGTVAGLLGASAFRDGGGSRTVVAQQAPPGAQVRLIVRDENSTLVTKGMPSPGKGRVYQVWLQRGEAAPQATNALFSVRSDGSATVDVPGDLDRVDAVLVTSEPEGGSQTPTRDPVLAVTPA